MYNILLYQNHHYLSSLSCFNFENDFFRSSLFRRGKRGQEAPKPILFSQVNNNHRIEIKNIFPITVRLGLLGEFFWDFSIFHFCTPPVDIYRHPLLSKTTTLHVHHAFLFISLPSLNDYDVKMPNFTFYGDVNKRRRIFLALFVLEYSPQGNQLQGNSPSFDIFSELEQTRQSFKKRRFVLQVTFSLPLLSSMLKLPDVSNAKGAYR